MSGGGDEAIRAEIHGLMQNYAHIHRSETNLWDTQQKPGAMTSATMAIVRSEMNLEDGFVPFEKWVKGRANADEVRELSVEVERRILQRLKGLLNL